MMTKDQKKVYIEEMTKQFESSKAIMVTHYQGLTMPQIDELRSKMREHGIIFKITKNRITKLALEKTRCKDLANLFTGAAYVFTPTADSKPEYVEKLKAIALELDAIPYVCNAKVHDRAVSWISHLPVMVSASLIKACLQEEPDILDLAQMLASSGFRDTSRVGGGNPELGVMMAKYNREEVLRSLYSYRDNLDKITSLIEAEDWDSLEQILEVNSKVRHKFLN